MSKFFYLIIFLVLPSFQSNGAEINVQFLNQKNILDYTSKLLDSQLNQKTREITSFKFKKFIESASYPIDPSEKQAAIAALYNIVMDPVKRVTNILSTDLLFDAEEYLLNKMLSLEITSQPYKIPSNNELAGFFGLIGVITENVNGSTISGTLLPVPVLNTQSNTDSQPIIVKWYIVSCAHAKIPEQDQEKFSMTFYKSNLTLPIKSMKFFRKKGKTVQILYPPDEPMPINTISLTDVRARILQDSDADVALYELDIDQSMHDFLSENILGKNYTLPEWDKDHLILHFSLANGKICYVHFVSQLHQARSLVEEVNKQSSSATLGHSSLGMGATQFFIRSGQRTSSLNPNKVLSGFIPEATVTPFKFEFNAPTYPGMSGGPIAYWDKNSIHFYGVVVGNSGALSIGSFLQDRLFLQNNETIGDRF